MVTAAVNSAEFRACLPQPEVLDHMAGEPDPDVDWLWEGFLARGCVTLLTSQWKTGKTTLLSVLLTQLRGGGELAGRKVSPGRVVILSEEDRMHWRMRSRRLHFGPHALAYCRPFKTNPSRAEWQALVDELVRRREQEGLDLVVFDTLSMLLPLGTENQFDIFQILRPLEQLTSAGVAVLLMHHPRKGLSLPGQAARGTGALTAYADIVVEMEFHSKSDRQDRRRRLASWSRYSASPAELIIELTEDGRSYRDCPLPDPEVDHVVEMVCRLSDAVINPLSRTELSLLWPGPRVPSPSALYTHLERAVVQGRLVRIGAGHREDPYRYGPPGMTEYVPRFGRSRAETPPPVANPVEPSAAAIEPVTLEPVTSAPEVVASNSVPVDSMVDLIDDESDTVLDVSQDAAGSADHVASAVEAVASACADIIDDESDTFLEVQHPAADNIGPCDRGPPPIDPPSFHQRE